MTAQEYAFAVIAAVGSISAIAVVTARNVGRDGHYRSSTGVAINVCVYPVSVLLST